jgi:UDP-glucuronate 4-epimerase
VKQVLVTGVAGFIGMHTARALAAAGARVTGVDNFEPYYDVALKESRVAQLASLPGFTFARLDLADPDAVARLFRDGGFTHVVHLAAQPGVRHSLSHPLSYLRNNVDAFGHVLEGCRHARVAHLVYASSSSVYGASHTLPFSEDQRVDQPVSLYAATKCANELMAYSYAHLFGFPATGLRFFTVYGPWGRPDQAPMLFAKAILAGQPIQVFNEGRMRRDFTYIDDIVEGVVRTLDHPPARSGDSAPAARAGPGRDPRLPADAARRHGGNLCIDRPAARTDGLRAAHAARVRDRPLRRLVPRLLPRLTALVKSRVRHPRGCPRAPDSPS